VDAAGEIAKAKGAKRVVPLIVGGPFHTPLIEKAAQWLNDEMQNNIFNSTDIPVISNVDALPSTDGAAIREKLVQQIVSPVRWVDCVEYMLAQGVRRFIEFGPQKVLSGMIKSIDKEAEVLNVDKLIDVAAVKEVIQSNQ
jgi:[acyl-carrier-protein] S-malonyltransferase